MIFYALLSFDICIEKILVPDIMGDQPTEETQFVVDEVQKFPRPGLARFKILFPL